MCRSGEFGSTVGWGAEVCQPLGMEEMGGYMDTGGDAALLDALLSAAMDAIVIADSDGIIL